MPRKTKNRRALSFALFPPELVNKMPRRPGQPGLRVNDLLVAIDGLPLWWHACQHDLVEDEALRGAELKLGSGGALLALV